MNKEESKFVVKDKDYVSRVKKSFELQKAMKTIGCEIKNIELGQIELTLPYNESLTQQHGFIHAGIISTAMDSACGYAAFSLMPEDAAVLSVEFKTNLLSPAKGDSFRIVGKVVKQGRTLTFCQADAFAIDGEEEKLISQMTATIMTVYNRGIEG